MNVPWRQHPKRAVLEPLLAVVNALEVPDKDSHLLPHKVRVKPLFKNTLKKEESVEWKTLFKNEISAGTKKKEETA